jgi:putative endonuclease
MTATSFQYGRNFEDFALSFYSDLGLTMVAKNFEYYSKQGSGRKGEIDLIMEDVEKKILYVVEVKARSNSKFGTALESINYQKVNLIKRALQVFLIKNKQFSKHYVKLEAFCLQSEKVIRVPIDIDLF